MGAADDITILNQDLILREGYRIVRLIGRGGMGCVYEALRLPPFNEIVALKQTVYAADDERQQWFQLEAEKLHKLSRNSECIPKVIDFFREKSGCYLVMEFIPGLNLREVLACVGPLSPDMVLKWASRLLEVLDYLHTSLVIHRDIKPDNIKIHNGNKIFLLDFGLAKDETTSGPGGGTKCYSSLEQSRGLTTDARSDLYSLGATLYYLLTGSNPPDAHDRYLTMQKGQLDLLHPIHTINPTICKELSEIVGKAMALEPQDRFATAKEMLEAIREVKIISLPSYELGQSETKRELAEAKKAFEDELEQLGIRVNSSSDEIKKWKAKAEAAQIKIDELNEEHETKIAKLKSEYEQMEAQLAESKRILNSVDNRPDLPPPSKQIKRIPQKRPEQPYWIELLLRRLSNRLFSSNLAIALGTTTTLVFSKGRGIVVSEPSIVAIHKTTNTIEAIGRDAKEMLGRTPGDIVAIRPMKDGVIANFEVVIRMLQHFIRKAHNGKTWLTPRVVIGIPSEITQLEVRAVEGSVYSANASNVYLVEKAMAAAIGAGLPISEPHGNMIVDIGGGTTDIAVISLFGIVYSRAVRIAGNEMDEAIMHYIKRKYDVLIGERTAEQIKIEIGSAFPLDESISIEVRGRNLIEGIPKTITITDEEVREALADSVSTIVNAVRVALERTPPEFASDIVEHGIVMTGGGALLKNFDKRLALETGLPVFLAEDPLSSAVIGLGRTLSDFNLLKRVKWNNYLTT